MMAACSWAEMTRHCVSECFLKLLSLLGRQQAPSEVIQSQGDCRMSSAVLRFEGVVGPFLPARKTDGRKLATDRPRIKQAKSNQPISLLLQLFMNSCYEAFCSQRHK